MLYMRSALQLWCKSWRQLQCRREMPKPEIQSLKGRKTFEICLSYPYIVYRFMTNLLLMLLQVRTWQDPCIKAEKGQRKYSNSGDLNV